MIVLLRHGQTDNAGRCIGRTAVPLTPEGERQAADLSNSLAGGSLTRLCSSPSRRALDTVAPLAEALNLPVDEIPGLDEIDMGAWDGMPFDDIRQEYPQAYAERGDRFGSFRPPRGESFEDVADRAMIVMNELAREKGHVMAVTHAGVIRAVSCRVTGRSLDDLFHFKPGHARCTVLSVRAGELDLVAADVAPAVVSSLLS